MNTVILNSRQKLRPYGSDPWVRHSWRALCRAYRDDDTILTSVGMSSWEMILYLVSRLKLRTSVFLPLASRDNPDDLRASLIGQYRLNPDFVQCRFIDMAPGRNGRLAFMSERDRLICADADRLIPVSINPKGTLDRLIAEYESAGKQIRRRHQIAYGNTKQSLKYSLIPNLIDRKLDKILDNHIIHWTRAANGPWPGETAYDFYDSIFKAVDHYSHNAVLTLKNILSSGVIFGSGKHTRKDSRAVSFSSLKPSRAAALMRWRARFRQMSFEPYGIAIEKPYAESIGIRPVIYGEPGRYKALSNEDRPYFQSVGKIGDWPREQEYRFIGDLPLTDIPPHRVKVICFLPDEARIVNCDAFYEIYSMYKIKAV